MVKSKTTFKINKTFIKKLSAAPIAVLDTLTDDEIAQLIQKANYDYHSTDSKLMSDEIYDIVREFLENRNPDHPILKAVGAPLNEDKVKLPYFMGSMDKIKTDDKLIEKFKATYTCSYVVSDKLDGNSALYHIDKDGNVKLYSRGDGTLGQDISNLIPYIQGLPTIMEPGFTARGEMIISRKNFESKLKDKGANARNMVAGVLNAKFPNLDIAKYIEFVAYELVSPQLTPDNQFDTLKKSGFTVAYHKTISEHILSNEYLSKKLMDRRKDSPYEVDGIVIAHNALHPRTKGNPKHAFAFKNIQMLEKAEVNVSHVEWNISKDGYIIPTVIFNPVSLAGVSIQRASGFNGKYIFDNKIGPGSVIIIIRSGDVIPHIVEVLKPASSGKAQMPSVKYTWSTTGVDVIVSDKESNNDMKFKNLEYFFNKIDIKGFSSGTIKKLFDAGYTDIRSIINITKEELLKIDGIQAKSAEKIYNSLSEGMTDIDCILLMNASNIMGRGMGSKKIEMIIKEIPAIISKNYVPTVDELVAIKGIEKKTATLFVENLPKYFEFYREIGVKCKDTNTIRMLSSKKVKFSGKFEGKVFVFTGFRDKELEDKIMNEGGSISNTINKNTYALITKDDSDKESGKIKKVHDVESKYGVKIYIYTKEEFIGKIL